MIHHSTFMRLAIGVLAAVAAPLVATACQPPPDIEVTTAQDELNNDGDCSLREAVRAANIDAAVDDCPAGNGADTIVVEAATYRLTRTGVHEQQGLTGDLDILESLTIKGAGSGSTFLDGNGTDRILDLFAPAAVSVNDVTIRNGVAPPGRRGGAIVVLQDADLTLRRSVVRNNSVSDGDNRNPDGGGIYNDGDTTIIDSTIRDNLAGGNEGSGGGLWNSGVATLTRTIVQTNTANGSNATTFLIDGGGGIYSNGTLALTDSTVSGNLSKYRGGGVVNQGAATINRTTISGNQAVTGGGVYSTDALTVTNSTISGNRANASGGGIWIGGSGAFLASLTIASNAADSDSNGSGDGGGLAVAAGGPDLKNSLLALNTDPGGQGPDCRGRVGSLGYNRFDSATGCIVVGVTTGNQFGGNSMLGPLTDHGGPTQTRALQPGSPAIDRANPGAPGSGGETCPTPDQRGVARPQDGNGDSIARCDIGAFERLPAT